MKFMELMPEDSAYLTSLTKKLAPPLGERFCYSCVGGGFVITLLSHSDSVVCRGRDPVCGFEEH